ncbi:MAG: hypothetical protein LKF35_02615 [Bifidobacterium minimum]|jgi:pilin isopeptide linkage protein|nr:hypothetical protein [Bifidobacterium minimum]
MMGNTIRGFVRSGLAAVVAIATLLTLALSGATASADATTSRVDISTIASSSTINLYKDEAETEPITTGTPINRGDTVYGSVSILFPAGSLSPENPNLEYDFPNDITVGDLAQQILYDKQGVKAGTWEIQDNKILVDYDSSYLTSHTSGVTLNFTFNFTVNQSASDGQDQTTVVFPGGVSVVIPFNPPQVTAEKTSKVNSDGTVDFTVTFSADSEAKNLAFVDSLGSDMTFDVESFKFDGNGIADGVTINNSTSPRTASATLGTVAKGQHTLTYTATLTDDAKENLLSGTALSNSTNTIDYTWDKSSKGQAANTPSFSFNGISKSFAGYTDATSTAKWTITVNSGTYKADMAGMTVTDQLQSAKSLNDDTNPGNSPAQTYTGDFTVTDSQGNVVARGATDSSASSFAYTFPTDKEYNDSYTITYYTKLTDPNVQRQYNNEATLSKGNTALDSATAQYARTGGFNDVHKAAGKKNADGSITWTVNVNSGTFRRDFGGVTFTDTLGDGMSYTGSYTVKDTTTGKTIVNDGTLDSTSGSFEYIFAEDAGYDSYSITYSTKLDDPSKLVEYSNVAQVSGGTIGDTPVQYTGKYDNTYKGQNDTFITKSIVKDDSIDSGKVDWKVTVKPGDIIKASHNPVVVDYLTDSWKASGVDYDHDTLVAKDSNGTTVSLGTVTWGRYNSSGTCSSDDVSTNGAPCFSFALTSSILDALSSGANLVLSYSTTAQNPNVPGKYGNTAVLKQDSATFQAKKAVTVPQNAIDKSGTASWDDKTKTWGIDYSVDVNKNSGSDSSTRVGIDNLHGQDVILTDKLGEDSQGNAQTYVKNSAKYTLTMAGKDAITASVDPVVSEDGSTLVFTIPTSVMCSTNADKASCYVAIHLTYRVQVPTDPYRSTSYGNTISGTSKDATFTDGSSTTTVDTRVLHKEGVAISGQPQVGYTIRVNEHSQTLNASKEIVLTDDLDYRTSLVASSVKVCRGSSTVDSSSGTVSCAGGTDADITASSSVTQQTGLDSDTNPIDVLKVTVPDSTYVSVFYRVMLNGKTSDTLTGVTNSAELFGIANSGYSTKNDFTVTKASGSTSGKTGSISINKIDADDASKSLGGAEFRLYKVDTAADNWDTTQSASTLVDTRTTGPDGSVTFDSDGTKSLLLNTLYYFVESKAPSGYHLDTTRNYFVLQDYDSSTAYRELISQVKSVTGSYPSSRTYITVSDQKLTPTTFTPTATKKLTGRDLTSNDKFTFRLHDGGADGTVLDTAQNDSDGNISFQPITYDTEGTFSYTITEDSGKAGGITYSTTPVEFTVTTKDDGTGKLVATASYGDTAPTITNTYAASGSFAPSGVKTLTGRSATSKDVYGFTVTDDSGDTVSTGSVDLSKSSAISFTPIEYSLKDVGTHRYTVSEDSSKLPAGVSATTGSLSFTVTVRDKGDGTLSATAAYPDGADGLEFTNTYATSQEVPLDLRGTKILSADGTDTTIADFDKAFSFSISGKDDSGKAAPLPVDSTGSTVSMTTNDALGNIDFGTVTYTQADLADATQQPDGSRTKTYRYTVEESAKQPSGVTADTTLTRHFDVTVTDDGQGHITAQATASADDAQANAGSTAASGESAAGLFTFHNTYVITPLSFRFGDAFTITKTLKNGRLTAGEFHFALTDTDTGKVVAKGTNDADGKVTFPAVSYEKSGTHHYTVTEVIPSKATKNDAGRYSLGGITYDSSSYAVTVALTDTHEGTLKAVATKVDAKGTATDGKTLTFVNTAALPTLTPLASTGVGVMMVVTFAFSMGITGLVIMSKRRRQTSGRHVSRA